MNGCVTHNLSHFRQRRHSGSGLRVYSDNSHLQADPRPRFSPCQETHPTLRLGVYGAIFGGDRAVAGKRGDTLSASLAVGTCHSLLSRGKVGVRLPILSEDTSRERGAVARDDRLAALEAVLFLSQHPQTSRKLAQLAGLADGTKARTLVRTLNRRYDAEGSAFRVEEVAGGFQLMTRSKFAPWLRRLHSAAGGSPLVGPGHGNPGRGGLSAAGVEGGNRSHPRRAIGRGPSPTHRTRPGADRRAIRRTRPAVPLRNHQTIPASLRTATSRRTPEPQSNHIPSSGRGDERENPHHHQASAGIPCRGPRRHRDSASPRRPARQPRRLRQARR